jgi:hypothetical protein
VRDDRGIDVDDPATWPEATHAWAKACASGLQYPTGRPTADIAISPEAADEFRSTLGSRRLIVHHSTHLLPHEVTNIRAEGLRLLSEASTQERLMAAVDAGALSPEAHRFAMATNIFATNNHRHREGQLCFVLGRSIFDEDPAASELLLAHWGGEAMRGGPTLAPPLTGIGRPAIIRVALRETAADSLLSFPDLANVFVGTALGLSQRSADVLYRVSVPAEDIVAIFQSGDSEYDCHKELQPLEL